MEDANLERKEKGKEKGQVKGKQNKEKEEEKEKEKEKEKEGEEEQEQEKEVAKSEPDANPFLVADPEDLLSDPESAGSPPAVSSPVVQSVTLESAPAKEQSQSAPPTPPEKPAATATTTTTSTTSPKSVSSSEDETPELHAPALTATSLFLPVPQVRTFVRGVVSLTWWLTTKAASYPLSYWPGLSTSRISRFLIHAD